MVLEVFSISVPFISFGGHFPHPIIALKCTEISLYHNYTSMSGGPIIRYRSTLICDNGTMGLIEPLVLLSLKIVTITINFATEFNEWGSYRQI